MRDDNTPAHSEVLPRCKWTPFPPQFPCRLCRSLPTSAASLDWVDSCQRSHLALLAPTTSSLNCQIAICSVCRLRCLEKQLRFPMPMGDLSCRNKFADANRPRVSARSLVSDRLPISPSDFSILPVYPKSERSNQAGSVRAKRRMYIGGHRK